MRVVPRVSLMQTWTDNLRLDDRNKDAALITMLSPGISIVSGGGALRGSLDYSLNGIAYFKSDQPSRVTNSLAASGQAELIPGTLYVDARANIGQQNASAFAQQSAPTLGSQGAVADLANPNQRETGTLSVSPLLRGALGSVATYDLRGDFTRTEVRGSGLGDSQGAGGSLRVDQRNAGVVGTWLSLTTQQTKASSTSYRSSELRLGVNYRPDPDWRFSANVGQERNDYLAGNERSGATGGVTADWTPTPRTQIGADWQHHNYGASHTLRLDHRMARSVWRFADMRSTTLGSTGVGGGVRSNYDLFFLLYASREPDPIKRDILVRSELLAQGLSPDAPATGGFLSSGPSRLHNQQLGFTFQGLRSSLTGQLSRTVTSRLGNNVNQGDLANSSSIEQRSYSLSASHQLTPLWGLSLTALRQETSGDLSSQSTRLTSVLANFSARVNERLSAQLGARHSRFEGVTPYTENGAYANLTQSF